MVRDTGGIADQAVAEMPIAVFDVETTGLIAGHDRVVEISVIRRDPGGKEELVLDTLINPGRPMAATEIHGITDEDVKDAPEFHEIVNDVVAAVSDCVLASYNVYFDMPFLEYELKRARIEVSPPHFCLMYMRPMLGLGKRCSLNDACSLHGIKHETVHAAAADAQAATQLMGVYLEEMRRRNIATFGDLADLKSYKFVKSFGREPIACPARAYPRICRDLKPRSAQLSGSDADATEPSPSGKVRLALGAYWAALKVVITDLEITDEEIRHLQQKERELGLQVEQVRALHARAFASVISKFVDDQWLDERERGKLCRLYQCLSQLGWAPGE